MVIITILVSVTEVNAGFRVSPAIINLTTKNLSDLNDNGKNTNLHNMYMYFFSSTADIQFS